MGFTILELLVVVGITSTLMSIILPAVGSVREAARRTQCTSRLRQIGVALHVYHEQHTSLPPGCQWEWTQQSAYGWATAVLPMLEQRAVYEGLDRNRAVFDPVNAVARQTALPSFVCPSDIAETSFMLFSDDSAPVPGSPLFRLPTANYVGVFGAVEPEEDRSEMPPAGDGAFIDGRTLRFADFQRGLSNSLFVGERRMADVSSTWLGFDVRADDALCRLVGMALTAPNCDPCDECEFSSRHSGGAMFLWGDGRVRLIPDSIDSSEYQRLARRYTE